MSRRLVAARLLLAAAVISAFAACASPTAPTSSRLKTGLDSTCRSGYSNPNGFHC
jgi:hypothetical protein